MSGSQLIKQYNHNELTDSDFEELASLSRAAFAEHLKQDINFRDTTITGAEIKRDILRTGDTVFAYYLEGKMAGYARRIKIARESHVYVKCNGMATMPECRGLHIGRQLTEATLAWAKGQGAEYMLLDTSTRAKRIVAYHHDHGYKDWYYGHWPEKNYISVFMRRDLGKPYPAIMRIARLMASWCAIHNQYTYYGQERTIYKFWKTLRLKLRIRSRLKNIAGKF